MKLKQITIIISFLLLVIACQKTENVEPEKTKQIEFGT